MKLLFVVLVIIFLAFGPTLPVPWRGSVSEHGSLGILIVAVAFVLGGVLGREIETLTRGIQQLTERASLLEMEVRELRSAVESIESSVESIESSLLSDEAL